MVILLLALLDFESSPWELGVHCERALAWLLPPYDSCDSYRVTRLRFFTLLLQGIIPQDNLRLHLALSSQLVLP